MIVTQENAVDLLNVWGVIIDPYDYRLLLSSCAGVYPNDRYPTALEERSVSHETLIYHWVTAVNDGAIKKTSWVNKSQYVTFTKPYIQPGGQDGD